MVGSEWLTNPSRYNGQGYCVPYTFFYKNKLKPQGRINKYMIIHPSCQFDFSKKPIPNDIRCTQCGGKYQSWTINCSKYINELPKYIEKKNDRPEFGKQYALTGGFGTKCILNGNTWAESLIE